MAEQALLQAENAKRSPTTERRAWVRLPCDLDTRCQSLADLAKDKRGTGWLGRVRNISCGGIGLILRQRLDPETDLIIDLATQRGELRQLRARVVHATLERNGQWITGCAFPSTLSEEELQRFVGE
jgi:hypothetical protein